MNDRMGSQMRRWGMALVALASLGSGAHGQGTPRKDIPNLMGTWEIGLHPTVRHIAADVGARHVWGIGLSPVIGYRVTNAVSVEGMLLGGWMPQLNRVDEETPNYLTPLAAVTYTPFRTTRLQPYVVAGGGYEILRFIQPIYPARSLHYGVGSIGAGLRYTLNYNASLRSEVSAQVSSHHRPTVTAWTGVSFFIGSTPPAPDTVRIVHVDTLRTTVTVRDTVQVRLPTVYDTTVVRVEVPVPNLERLESDMLFDFDRASIKAGARPILDTLARRLVSGDLRDAQLQIQGHTDSMGAAEYNLILGMRRAGAIRDYLVKGGVPVERLQVVSAGETNPVSTNATDVGRRDNRRIVILRVR